MTSKGQPFVMTTSASLPTSSEPTRSATPMCSAGLMVMAFSASNGSMPALTAMPAQSGRYCCGMTELSVMMDTWQPALASTPGVFQDLFCSSNLLANVRLGPTAIGTSFSFASSSAMRCPSVTCSSVRRRSNSRAMRSAVKMSLAWWAWAFKGISRASTGSKASSFWL